MLSIEFFYIPTIEKRRKKKKKKVVANLRLRINIMSKLKFIFSHHWD